MSWLICDIVTWVIVGARQQLPAQLPTFGHTSWAKVGICARVVVAQKDIIKIYVCSSINATTTQSPEHIFTVPPTTCTKHRVVAAVVAVVAAVVMAAVVVAAAVVAVVVAAVVAAMLVAAADRAGSQVRISN